MKSLQTLLAGLLKRRGLTASLLLWLAIGGAYFYPLFLFPIHNPNERVRIYMTVAMADHDTFAIGYRKKKERGRGFTDSGSAYDRWGYVNDKALVCDNPEEKPPNCEGTLYSAKAPGSSFLGYPVYLAAKATHRLFGDDAELSMEAIILWLRLVVVVIPTVFMLIAYRRFAAAGGYDPVLTDLTTAGVAIGSMVYTYAHMFAGHQICTYFLFFAFLAAWKARGSSSTVWPVLSGLFSGMAVFSEYPMALVSLALFGYLMRNRFTLKTFFFFCLGGVIPGALTAWFHDAAFGSPFTTAYTTLENTQFVKDIAPGVMGMRAPCLENLWGAFISPFEGLFYFAPWMALCLVAIPVFYAARFRKAAWPERADFAASTASVMLMTLFIASHSLWRGGWTLGPRYIVPFVPFAALTILHASSAFCRRAPTVTRATIAGLVLLSIIVTGSCSLVSQGFHTIFYNPLAAVTLPLLRDGFVTWSLGHLVGLRDHWPLVPLVVMIVPGLAFLLWRSSGHTSWPWQRRLFVLSLVLLVTAGGFKGLLIPAKKTSLRSHKALTWTRHNFYPYDHRNSYLRQTELTRTAAQLFPQQDSLQLLRMNRLLTEGYCKGTISADARRRQAEKARFEHSALLSALTAIQPFPTGVPFPLTLRPDFRLSRHALKRLKDHDKK